ncbi:hypothetical protein ACFQ21_06415 [Ohtaekwangia kribbensis]|uniref:WD40 repeat domain-containing protein n=1 Tax=Ohtaekwangia kribbensis TaxID=688913 RepID=A0ABW3JYM3_9BACT
MKFTVRQYSRHHSPIPVYIKVYVLLLTGILLYASASAQTRKIKTLEVSDTIRYAAVDRPGELYIVTTSGQLQKFDTDGKLLALHKDKPAPTLFDPRDGSRLFAFFRESRQYNFLNPSFEAVQAFSIDSSFATEPWLACVSGDYNIWLFDVADWTLKKINTTTGALSVEEVIETKSKQKSNYTFLREYQGFVFLLDVSEGILIFNGVGKHIRTIAVKNLSYFNFLGEELYYLQGDTLRFFDLFTTETREQKLATQGNFALITDERFFLIRKNIIEIYRAQ